MPAPFSLEYVAGCDQLPNILVTQEDSNGLKHKSNSGQNLWDIAQDTLDEFPPLLHTMATVHIRLDTPTRDHRRTYCTVRAPGGTIKYSYKFFCGVGEWVATEITRPDPNKQQRQKLPVDFYGRKAVPVDPEIFWGLNGLLGHAWYPSHGITCHTEHYDIFINMFPDDTDTSDPAKLLASCGPKDLTHLQVCADARVATLFQMLIGLEKATNLNSLAHCLTGGFGPFGTKERVKLGPELLFEDMVRNGMKMQETGWFVQGVCCLLISTKRTILNSKFRHTFMFQKVLETRECRSGDKVGDVVGGNLGEG